MEFGKVANVDSIDFSLPDDDPIATRYLSRFPAGKTTIRFGAPVWNRKHWVGTLYPEKTKPVDFLRAYADIYNCIELNTTHYRIPTDDQTAKWLEQVSDGFQFCPKIYQGISHAPMGLLDRGLMKEWLTFLSRLGENGGPSFLQLPPYFDYGMKGELFAFLKMWPNEFRLAIEFRHPSWFSSGRILEPLVEYLQTRTMGLVITDVAGRRDVLHTSISAPFSLLRFIGNDFHPSDIARAAAWTERFQRWQEQGLQDLYLYIHEPDDVKTPEMTAQFLEFLRAAGWTLQSQVQGRVRQASLRQLTLGS